MVDRIKTSLGEKCTGNTNDTHCGGAASASNWLSGQRRRSSRGSDFPSYFVIGVIIRRARCSRFSPLCCKSRGGLPLSWPPTHFVQHFTVCGKGEASSSRARRRPQPTPSALSGLHPRRVPASSSPRSVRKNAAVGQLRGFASSPDGGSRTPTLPQSATQKSGEERDRQGGGECASVSLDSNHGDAS